MKTTINWNENILDQKLERAKIWNKLMEYVIKEKFLICSSFKLVFNCCKVCKKWN